MNTVVEVSRRKCLTLERTARYRAIGLYCEQYLRHYVINDEFKEYPDKSIDC